MKEEREKLSGARGKTGMRAFMAIGPLPAEKQFSLNDIESFFFVLFWFCVHYVDELWIELFQVFKTGLRGHGRTSWVEERSCSSRGRFYQQGE
jgi:hypothetical protein